MIKLFIGFLLIFFNLTFTYANEKINYMNLDYVIKNSISGKLILKEINLLQKKNFQTLKSKEKIIKDKENTILKQKNILTENDFNSKITALRNEIKEFNEDRKKLMSEFENKKKSDFDNLLKKISPLIEEYMKKNSIDFIFNQNSVFVANKKFDISDEILKLVNEKIK